jgi:hypothetical protein
MDAHALEGCRCAAVPTDSMSGTGLRVIARDARGGIVEQTLDPLDLIVEAGDDCTLTNR